MRIAIWHNLPSGGGKRGLYDHVDYLVATGHYVESWCPPSADQSFLPLRHLITEHVLPVNPVAVNKRVVLQQLASTPTLALEQWIVTVCPVQRRLHAVTSTSYSRNSCSSFLRDVGRSPARSAKSALPSGAIPLAIRGPP